MVPWLLFFVVFAYDMGMYSYALICTEGAARAAAMYTSTSAATATDSTTACRYALDQMRDLPNVPSSITTCTSSPVTVSATEVTGPDGSNAAQVTVTYVPPALASIPGSLTGNYTLVRTVQIRLQS